MRKIALVNQKGGCGKTTTAINLASCLAGEGREVLLIDLDPQGHSAMGLGVNPDQIEKSVYEVLLGKIPINKAIQNLRKNLDAVFSNVVLSAFEQVMAGVPEREYKLARCIEDIENNYDYLIIDSPPSVGLLTFNGLMASGEVIIPVDSSSFALHGLGKLLETIRLVAEKAGHELSVKILATNIDRRTKFSRSVAEKLKADFPEHCFKTAINTCTRLREAAGQGMPITEYDKHCIGFHDYQELTEEFLCGEAEIKLKPRVSALESVLEVGRPVREPVEKEIVFTLEAPEDAMVQIAGDFNGWAPESLHLTHSQDKPLWQKALWLRQGSYQYKYLVDGHWVPDPVNAKTDDDLFGGVNSIINV